MSVAKTLRRLLHHEHRCTSGIEPQDYWEARHRSHERSLRAVGHRQLSDDANAEQYEVKRAQIAQMIRRYIPDPRGKTLLDAGCGIGVLTASYVELGFEVVGVDFSGTAVRTARGRGINARFLVSPLARLSIEERFDVITAIDVLLHVVDDLEWSATLASFERHLAPDGLLIILDHFASSPQDRSDHYRPRAKEAYAEALSAVSLSIEAHERFALVHEGSTKDLIAVRRKTAPRP